MDARTTSWAALVARGEDHAMSTLRRVVLLLALASVAAASSPAEKTFIVTSGGSSTVSIDGGRAHDVNVGDRFRVVEGTTSIAELEVASVAERWASCRVVSRTRPVRAGDRVISTLPAAAGSSAPLAPASAAPAAIPSASTTAVQAPPKSAPVAAPAAAVGRSFRVEYRSAANVYLDGGRAAGLEVGDRLRVLAGGTAVAEIEVMYVAEQSASCKVISEVRPVRAGDAAQLLLPARRSSAPGETARAAPPGADTPPSVAPSSPTAASPGKKPVVPWGRVRGGASFGYYQAWDQTESDYDFQERTGRLDLGLYDLGGRPLSFSLRGRSRQDVRSRSLSDRTPKSERTDRLYEVALRYEPPSDEFGIEVGRIGIYRFVGIGYLDGVLGRFRPLPAVQVGGFAGRIADIETLGFGGTGGKFGGFVRLAPGGRYATGGYDATLAFVRENAEGEVSREYLSLESRFGNGSRWSLFQRAELDLNTGWREEVTGKSYQFSNVSLSGSLRVAASAWAFVSYDGRRNYRYYLNRVVPEEVFDDLLHQGLRAGVNVSKAGGFGATAGFGMSLKEEDPRNPELEIANAYSFNAGVRHSDVFSSGFSAGIDGSGFSNGYTDGGLVIARVGRRFDGGHMLDLSLGGSVYRMKLTEQNRSTQWLRLMGRAELGHRVYLQGDFEYDTGDDLEGPRGFLELGILF
jgi:hypothetical protein